MALDLAVTRAITQLRLLERALHDRGPWLIQLGQTSLHATRTVLDDRVVFTATSPELAIAETGLRRPVRGEDVMQMLWCGDDVMAVREAPAPDFAPFIVDWEVIAADSVVAA